MLGKSDASFRVLLQGLQSSIPTMRGDSERQLFSIPILTLVPLVLDVVREDAETTNLKYMAVLVLESRVGSEIVSLPDEKSDSTLFIRIFDAYMKTKQAFVEEKWANILGALCPLNTTFLSHTVESSHQLENNSPEFSKVLLLMSKFIYWVSRQTSHVTPAVPTEIYKSLQDRVITDWTVLSGQNLALVISILRGLGRKRVWLPFRNYLQSFKFVKQRATNQPKEYSAALCECLELLSQSLSKVKLIAPEIKELYLLITQDVEKMGEQKEESLVAGLCLLESVLKVILQENQGTEEWIQNGITNFTEIFRGLMLVLDSKDELEPDVFSRCSTILHLLKDYLSEQVIQNQLNYQLSILSQQQPSIHSDKQISIYLDLSSILIKHISTSSLLTQVLTHIDQPSSPRLLISCLHFLQSLIASGTVDVVEIIKLAHPQMMAVLNKTQDLQIREEVYRVIASYIHKSVPVQSIKEICGEILSLMSSSTRPNDLLAIVQSLMSVGDCDYLKECIHYITLSHIQPNLNNYLNCQGDTIHLFSKLIALLSYTLTRQSDPNNLIYQTLTLHNLNTTSTILIDQTLHLLQKVLVLSEKPVEWASVAVLRIFYERIQYSQMMDRMVPILIQIAVHFPVEVEQFCAVFVMRRFSPAMIYEVLPLLNIVSILRGKDINQELIEYVLGQMGDIEEDEVRVEAMRMTLRKGDKTLAARFPQTLNYRNIFHLNVFGLKTAQKYLKFTSSESSIDLSSIEQALNNLSLQPKSSRSSPSTSPSLIYRRPFLNYNYIKNSRTVLNVLRSDEV